MLDKKDVQHVSKLARLELTDNEISKMSDKLSNILNFIDQLTEVNTEGVEPTSQVTGLVDVLRDDKVINWDKNEIDDALKEAPEIDGDEIKVARVL